MGLVILVPVIMGLVILVPVIMGLVILVPAPASITVLTLTILTLVLIRAGSNPVFMELKFGNINRITLHQILLVKVGIKPLLVTRPLALTTRQGQDITFRASLMHRLIMLLNIQL